jgi:predicted RNA-binding Zn ribbon-like protein
MASSRLAIALAFLNSRQLDGIPDAFASPESATRWLAGTGFTGEDEDLGKLLQELRAIAGSGTPSEADIAAARRVRDLLLAWIDGEAMDALPGAAMGFAADTTGGGPGLVVAGSGITALAAHAFLVLCELRIAGKSERLRRCQADDCRWVFYDRSRNRSKVWCHMSGCGSRAKARAYRARRTGTSEMA